MSPLLLPGAFKLDLKEETDGPISDYQYRLNKYENKLQRIGSASDRSSGRRYRQSSMSHPQPHTTFGRRNSLHHIQQPYQQQQQQQQQQRRNSVYSSAGGGGNAGTRTMGLPPSVTDLTHDVTYQALIRQRAVQIMNEKEAIYSRLARRGQEKKVSERMHTLIVANSTTLSM